jgi:hypothetical protein
MTATTTVSSYTPSPFQTPSSIPPRKEFQLHFSSELLSAKALDDSTLESKKGPPANNPMSATTLTTAFKKSGGGLFPEAKTVCQTGAKLAFNKQMNPMVRMPFWYSASDFSSSSVCTNSSGVSPCTTNVVREEDASSIGDT